MILKSDYLAYINPASLITIVDYDTVVRGLSQKKKEFFLDSFRLRKVQKYRSEDFENSIKLSLHIHETRHFHDVLLTSFGNYIFQIYFLNYINWMTALLPWLTKKKEISIPLDLSAFSEKATGFDGEAYTLINMYNRTREALDKIKKVEDVDLTSLSILENIAYYIQTGYIEDYISITEAFDLQREFQKIGLTSYYMPSMLIMSELIKEAKKNTEIFIFHSIPIIRCLFNLLMFNLPANPDNYPLENFANMLTKLKKYQTNAIWGEIEKISKVDYSETIWQNINEFERVYNKVFQQTPNEHKKTCKPIIDLAYSYLNCKKEIMKKITIEDYNNPKKYLDVFDDLPKNPVVFISDQGIELSDDNKELFYLHLYNLETNKLHVFSYKGNWSQHFSESWKVFFSLVLPLEFLFMPNIISDNPMIVLLLNKFADMNLNVSINI